MESCTSHTNEEQIKLGWVLKKGAVGGGGEKKKKKRKKSKFHA